MCFECKKLRKIFWVLTLKNAKLCVTPLLWGKNISFVKKYISWRISTAISIIPPVSAKSSNFLGKIFWWPLIVPVIKMNSVFLQRFFKKIEDQYQAIFWASSSKIELWSILCSAPALPATVTKSPLELCALRQLKIYAWNTHP